MKRLNFDKKENNYNDMYISKSLMTFVPEIYLFIEFIFLRKEKHTHLHLGENDLKQKKQNILYSSLRIKTFDKLKKLQ